MSGVALATLVACGGGGSDSSGSDSVSHLQGTWTSACDDGLQVSYQFSGDNLYFSPTFYWLDDNCQYDGDYYDRDLTATYKLGKSVTTESGLPAQEIDITFTQVKFPDDYEVEVGDTQYSLIYVDGNKLYLGDDATGEGTTPATRPTALDLSDPFFREGS